MHKYFVEIYRYNIHGALESRPFTTLTADNELQLRKIRDQYAYEMQMDEEGFPTTLKAYKVVAHKIGYHMIADLDAEINGIFE